MQFPRYSTRTLFLAVAVVAVICWVFLSLQVQRWGAVPLLAGFGFLVAFFLVQFFTFWVVWIITGRPGSDRKRGVR